jgi:hypothetical protein
MFPLCNLQSIISAGSWPELLWQMALAVGTVLRELVEHSYVSLGALIMLVFTAAAFTEAYLPL